MQKSPFLLGERPQPLLAIEALGGAGKTDLSENLADNLRNLGYGVQKMHYPIYASPTGEVIGGYLHNNWIGDMPATDINPYAAATLYALNRYESAGQIQAFLSLPPPEGALVILDRYRLSNMAYQGAKILDHTDRHRFMEWIVDYETEKLGIPVPDCTILVELEPTTAVKNVNDRAESGGEGLDGHELDPDFSVRVANAYREGLVYFPNAHVIQAYDAAGNRLSRELLTQNALDCLRVSGIIH
jgi:dTMP kinase